MAYFWRKYIILMLVDALLVHINSDWSISQCCSTVLCCKLAGRILRQQDLSDLKLEIKLKRQHLLCMLHCFCATHLEINSFCPPSQFLCLKNIRTFLAACSEIFGMKKSELFEAFDLFDVRDFGKVRQHGLGEQKEMEAWLSSACVCQLSPKIELN